MYNKTYMYIILILIVILEAMEILAAFNDNILIEI